MRCCVQNCFNDDSKKTNKSQGITFHKLPKDPDHSAAWLKALAGLGCRMCKCLVVCSEHFVPEDFDETRPNQRRVKSGAVPTVMAPVRQDELKVCRVCLALDVKMYDMKDFKLSEMFQNITGILACDKKESILHRVCWECAARLTAAAAFRDKALLSDTLLKDLVHINKSDIVILKQNHSSLKSPLTAQTVFTTSDIECEHTISEVKEIEIILNDETDIKKRKSKIKINKEEKETEFDEYEPWIDVPMKTEIESDPIAENNFNIRFQDRKTDTFLELTHFNDSYTTPRDSEDEIRNTEEQINNYDKILSEDTEMSQVPIINNDGNIVLVNDHVDIKPKLDVIGNIVDESSSEEDTQSTTVQVSVTKVNEKMSSEVWNTNDKATIRNDETKERIIALKKMGLSVPAIAKETGISITSIYAWLHRYCKGSNITYRRSTTLGRDPSVIERDAEQNYYYSPTDPGKEIGACSTTVRRRLRHAGLEHILMNKPERTVNMGQKISKYKALHDDLKQRIIALKQEGISNSRIAYLLETSRGTVHKWWNRWCNEGHMNNHKITGTKRKTTAQEDQLLIDRVTQEQTVHTPSLAKELGISAKSVRNRLREAGFKLQERKASVPLRSGRSHKVDADTKLQIISMKHNGVSVTDIANQFRVTRTSVYLWWRRWCKENNIKTSENNTNTTTEQERRAEDTNVEKCEHTPSILSSKKSLWQKLPDVEFIS